MQPTDTSQPLGQPGPGQTAAGLVDQLDIMVVLGPVIPNEQHASSPMDELASSGSGEETTAI
jgi:hypothetical protein